MLCDLQHNSRPVRAPETDAERGVDDRCGGDVYRQVDVAGQGVEAHERGLDREQLELLAETDLKRFGEPFVRGAEGHLREPREGLDTDNLVATQLDDRLEEGVDAAVFEDLCDARARIDVGGCPLDDADARRSG